ncbi:MAG: TIM barrel protein [Planctomycetes bacterium]|nr:TIM barrel protein [Planctomycetota bacterium]
MARTTGKTGSTRTVEQDEMTRRAFLGGAAALAAAGALGPFAEAGEEKRRRPRRLPVACRAAHLRETGEKDSWAALKAIGADGAEVDVADDLALSGFAGPDGAYSIASDAAIEKLAKDMRAARLRITAFCLHNRFDDRPDFEIDLTTKTAKAAGILRVPAVRIDLIPRKLKGDAFLKFAIETAKKLVAQTEDTGVAFGLENHGGTTNDPAFLKPLFDAVPSKRFGLTLDTANFYWFGHPLSELYKIYETFAPRAVHTHCKSINYPEAEREKRRPMGWEYGKYNCPIDKGDLDFRRIVGILRAAGYRGDLCIEDESLGKSPAGERKAVLARQVAFLKELA